MPNTMTKFFTSSNAFMYRLTGGRLGSRMGQQTVLLLHTVGRKSGKPYVTPLSFYRDGANYLLVASNWGKEEHPDWFLNLMQQPRTRIQVLEQTVEIEARQAQGEEYERLWKLVTGRNSQYIQYQKGIQRRIPIAILAPVK